MFNNYTELHKLKNIAEKNGILLIEDNAIYLGNYYQDQITKFIPDHLEMFLFLVLE